ncbi:glycosyltransferase family 4 protein [Alkalibacillus salilacus]|uniref:Glycosyltransferase involved in cell wall biosynthesis n=1 Tax=Alkalibacillus salilacus TaxID=284582 RepID=A0ABT9VI18_9BACI|nr:glycosyltransferase family 4 protein [Alkalibacillus salilacus]MDQ0160532.1 glycosyltransferase involved in cell wall biosynthesis [Alkalibacillus salilacus]
MKILISTIFDYPHEGGLSTHITTLKKGLIEHGHEVDILSWSDCSKRHRLFIRGLTFSIKRMNKGKGQLFGDRQRMNWLKRKLAKIYQEYDVVNTQDIFATLAAKDLNIKTVQTVHGYYTYEATSRGAIQNQSPEAHQAKRYEQEAYTSADDIVCVDQRLKEYVRAESGREAHMIHNSVDSSLFNISSEEIDQVRQTYQLPKDQSILLVPRRLTEKNGVIYPILALPKILKQFPNTLLVYAGSGELIDTLKQVASKLNASSHIAFLGSVPHSDMIGLYKLTDIVLIPSIHAKGVEEATSIAALEGMTAGKPVIAGAVGGLKELIQHQENGLLFENKNEHDLAEQVLSLLNNSELSHALAKNAQHYVERNHSHLASARTILEIYSS